MIWDYVFVNLPKLTANASDGADEMANPRYNKLLRRSFGLSRVLTVQLHTVTIEEDAIRNTLAIDLLTL